MGRKEFLDEVAHVHGLRKTHKGKHRPRSEELSPAERHQRVLKAATGRSGVQPSPKRIQDHLERVRKGR